MKERNTHCGFEMQYMNGGLRTTVGRPQKPKLKMNHPNIAISYTPDTILDGAQRAHKIPLGIYVANNDNHNINNEIRDHLDDNEFASVRDSPIQDFYAGQSVLITGGTGFIGKILIEKLLRSCPKISKIYLLIRDKKDRNMEERIDDLFNNSIYDRLRKVSSTFRKKVVGISGDCSVGGLGISSADREHLLREISIVFHCAATVRLVEKLDIALRLNVSGTIDVMDLCKHMHRLKALIHVSTTYANCPQLRIEESFYPHEVTFEDLQKSLEGLGDREIEEMTPKILSKWPNTYTFTKSLAEDVIMKRSKDLPMGIFRPAVVVSSAYEPMPGWTDNLYGVAGFAVGIFKGIFRSVQCSTTSQANIVPVDFAVNALIAIAWDVAHQPERRADNMLIYNYISTIDHSFTWEQCIGLIGKYAKEYPLCDAIWSVGVSIDHSKATAMLSRIFLHYVPAVLVDFCRICLGYPPILVKIYKKAHNHVDATTRFRVNNWIYTNNNMVDLCQRLDAKDRQIFRCSVKDLDWDIYFQNYMKGIRVYLLKDDLSTLKASKRRAERFIWIHEALKALLFTLLFWVLWKVVVAVF